MCLDFCKHQQVLQACPKMSDTLVTELIEIHPVSETVFLKMKKILQSICAVFGKANMESSLVSLCCCPFCWSAEQGLDRLVRSFCCPLQWVNICPLTWYLPCVLSFASVYLLQLSLMTLVIRRGQISWVLCRTIGQWVLGWTTSVCCGCATSITGWTARHQK